MHVYVPCSAVKLSKNVSFRRASVLRAHDSHAQADRRNSNWIQSGRTLKVDAPDGTSESMTSSNGFKIQKSDHIIIFFVHD